VSSSLRALTLQETTALVSRLAGRTCSERRVRYLLIAGGLGTDAHRRPHGRTRLYGVLDVALVRLALAMQEHGASPWLTRVVLTYLRNDLVRAWNAAAPLALAVRGVQATLEPALKGRPPWATLWIPLREIWRELDAAVQRTCDARAEVWMYRLVKVRAVPRNTT